MKQLSLYGVSIIFIALVGMGLYSLYIEGIWRFTRPDLNQYPVWGIDVSHHQKNIDWPGVKTTGAKFAFIKVTEGGTHIDSHFQKNWDGARKAGLAVAPYHFFTLCRSGVEQAAHFLNQTAHISPTLPIVVDLEFVGNCKHRPTPEVFHQHLNDFIVQVEKQFSRKAIFYTTSSFQRAYLSNTFHENPRWMRNIFWEPSQTKEPWIFWQFADNARIAGINGPVDLNVFSQNLEKWNLYIK